VGEITEPFISSKALVVASGIVLSSAGAYFLYKKWIRQRQGAADEDAHTREVNKRQPSENTDDSNMYIPAAGTKIIVLGLEKSGKSSLLAAMVNDETQKPYQPTPGFNAICITNIDQRLDIMEIGGSQRYREHWDKFLNDSKIILYVIDSCEKDVLPASLDALKSLVINNGKEDIPIVVVFSKRDCSTAIPVQELISFVEKENLGERIYKYTEVQVKCGGADTTKGVNQLREILVELARSS